MAMMPDSLRLTAGETQQLDEIRRNARIRHEKDRKAAAKRGRLDYPDFPYECSWAFETQWLRQKRYPGFGGSPQSFRR